jgi:hypothetical protein
MAKRFIDTNFYKSVFVRSLPGKLKSLYSFIITDCSHSGIWIKDLTQAGYSTGFSFTEDEFENHFIESGKAIQIKNGVFFFPDFIEHQYPTGLSEKNNAHKSTIAELKKYGIDPDNIRVKEDHLRATCGPKEMVMDMDKVMVKEKVMETVKETAPEKVFTATVYPDFSDFWSAYDHKQDRKEAERAWGKVKQPDREKIMQHLELYVPATFTDGRFPSRRNPTTYLNKQTWLNEIPTSSTKPSGAFDLADKLDESVANLLRSRAARANREGGFAVKQPEHPNNPKGFAG